VPGKGGDAVRDYEAQLAAPAYTLTPRNGLRRRGFVALLCGAALAPVVAPLAALAQQPGKRPTVGFLGATTPTIWGAFVSAFVQRLRELGWNDGQNLAIEYRWAEGREDRYAAFAAELVQRKVDIIVTAGTPAVLAVMKATSTIPIVFAAAGDPVQTGLVSSLAHPGGNVTGLSNQQTDLGGLRLELLREIAPGVKRVAVLGNVDSPIIRLEMDSVLAAATKLGLEAPGSHQYFGGQSETADHERVSGVRPSRRPDVVRTELPGSVPAVRRLCRQDPARGEAGRHPGRAAGEVRSHRQQHDREGAWAENPRDIFDARQRSD
jgi:hypothetical protein